MEGGLRRPKREPLGLQDPVFWDEAALDAEMRRQFDVCHGCRRCFNLCDSFPRLFDLIDAAETMELDSVPSSGFRDVVGACTLCDMCFMVSCPYVPPHEFRNDFPRLMLRARAIEFRKGDLPWRDRQLAEIDRNGRLAAFGAGARGVLELRSSLPVTVTALQQVTNIRGETIESALPPLSPGNVFPYVPNGDGLSTEFRLANVSPSRVEGRLAFTMPSGEPASGTIIR